MKISIGNDHAGPDYKKAIVQFLESKGHTITNMQTRLNKYISDTGTCSRREADKLIEQGRVTVNGKIPELGTKVSDEDVITIDLKPLKPKEKLIYIAFNKPPGITCTTDLKDKDNIIEFINHPKRIFPIGRLDKPSEGLIFMTNFLIKFRK